MPRRLDAARLRGLDVSTLVLVADKSRSHDPAQVAANARELLPRVVTESLPGATHHTIPIGEAGGLNDRLVRFLSRNGH